MDNPIERIRVLLDRRHHTGKETAEAVPAASEGDVAANALAAAVPEDIDDGLFKPAGQCGYRESVHDPRACPCDRCRLCRRRQCRHTDEPVSEP